jgi:hypothetical protein
MLAFTGTADAGPRHGFAFGIDALSTADDDDYDAYDSEDTSEDAAEALNDAIDTASDYLGVDVTDVDNDD